MSNFYNISAGWPEWPRLSWFRDERHKALCLCWPVGKWIGIGHGKQRKRKKNTRKGASERQTFRSKRMMIRNKILWAMKVVITELLTVSMDWLWSLWGLSLHTDDTDGQRDRVWLLSVCFGAVGFVEVHPTVLVLFTKVQILSNPEQFWLPCSLCLKDSEKPDRNSTDC